MKILSRFLHWLDSNLEEFFMVVFLVALTCIMMFQVVMRYVFKSPVTWAEEACRYCFVYSVMLATGYCIRRGSMLKVDVVIRMFPERVTHLLDIVAQVLAIVFCAIMLGPAIRVVASAYKVGNVSSALELPMWILYTSAPVGFFLGIIRGLQILILTVRKSPLRGRKEAKL